MKEKRSVVWLEARQDRAGEAADRRSRVAWRIANGGACLTRREWIHTLCDQAYAIRAAGARYGRAKSRIGVYDPVCGWADPPDAGPRPVVGQRVTVRGVACEIDRVHPTGTVDVVSLDGRYAWRVSGLGF